MIEGRTLAVDIGGTGIKATVFDADGAQVGEARRVPTQYPCPPEALIAQIAALAGELPEADRIAAGFNGLVRSDRVVWVNSLTKLSPNGPTDPDLAERWVGYPLQQGIANAMGLPTIVANDADVHALASVEGEGMECVITLGTGLGFSVLVNGDPIPHLEFGGLPCVDGRDYDTALGQVGLERDGLARWIGRVVALVEALRAFLYFDHLYIGGGNARLLVDTDLGSDVSTVDNVNGLLGCHLLWKHPAWVSPALPVGQSDEGAARSH